jgi:hypothetical protein
MKPRDTKTLKQICSLQSDCHDTKEAWILVDIGVVYLHLQRNGEKSTSNIMLSRKDFNVLIDWYNKDQK